jgi:hypothetical protein
MQKLSARKFHGDPPRSKLAVSNKGDPAGPKPDRKHWLRAYLTRFQTDTVDPP